MRQKFNSKSTADEVLAGQDYNGKNVIITGANAGIGFECAKAFAKVGAHVVLACRSKQKATEAIHKIKEEIKDASLEFIPLDLADFSSIKAFSENLKLEKVDVLINNAGLMKTEYSTTPQGHEMTAGVNHFGHFYLTKLLLPLLLKSSARVVVLSSDSHKQTFSLNLDKWPQNKKDFGFNSSYAKSKLANLLFSNELHKRYKNQGLTATACHPGNLVTTDFGEGMPFINLLFKLISPFTKSPEQGASTPVFCASQPAKIVGGHYFSDNKRASTSKLSKDEDLAKRLWEYSEREIAKYS